MINGATGSPISTSSQAKNLLDDVLFQYGERTGVTPDRVVIHKTTTYEPEEIAGFQGRGQGSGRRHRLCLDTIDGVSDGKKGLEEPWRGTLCTLKDQSYLFTGGYVPWWNEYPGMHIPAPLEVGAASPTDMKERSKEILTLTKMNWNSSDGISRVPITILFARRVGELMCELSENAAPKPSYRFYI